MNEGIDSAMEKPGRRAGRVVLAAFGGTMLLDLAGPAQVFQAVRDRQGAAHYTIVIASMAGGPVATDVGMMLETTACAGLVPAPGDTLIVPGGPGAWDAAADPAFLAWIRMFAAGADRVASVCLGAVVLGAAGLLDDRVATTHWRHCDRMQRMFPRIRVERRPIFVRDGTVWTSAGAAAGIDLALAMVTEDLGHGIALDVAQSLVVFLKRPGSQAQYSAVLAAQRQSRDGRFADLCAWIADNVGTDLRVERLADRAGMTPRTFARAFKAATGRTPAKAVEALRVEGALGLLETSSDPLGVIARRIGFGDDERMRRSFLRLVGVSPAEHRARLSTTSP